MATRLYLTNSAPPVIPSAFQGSWDDAGGAVTRALATAKAGAHASVGRNEFSSSSWDVCLYRGVSDKLASQVINGTLNLVIGVSESAADTDACWHVHAYVMAPDGSVRGTLLADYIETTANEWPTGNSCLGLQAAQSLSSVTCQDGDRLVVELGASCRNTLAAVRTVSLYYGGTDALDATPGSSRDTTVGWVEFSSDLSFGPVEARLSQVAVEALRRGDPGVRLSQVAVEALRRGEPSLRVSQLALEVVSLPAAPAAPGRSQVVIIV